MGEALEPKILAWIRKGGVPLEYAAARVLARVGLDVVQGRTYPDLGADGQVVHREIDVVGTYAGHRGETAASVVVECKHTKDKPWIVLTNKSDLSAIEVLNSIVADDLSRASLSRAQRRSAGAGLPAFLRESRRGGFSVIAADLGDSDDHRDDQRNRARSAMAQVVSAARGLVESRMGGTWSVAWPVLLIDGPLFELDFNDSGEEELVAVDWKRVLWHGSPFGTPVPLDIVRESDFERYSWIMKDGLTAIVSRLSEDRFEFNSPGNLDDYGHPKPLTD